jgi:hypothetical protein
VIAIALAEGITDAGCSNAPSASSSDLYLCGQVAYWDNYVSTGKVPAAQDAPAVIRILRAGNINMDLTLTEELVNASNDYAANRTSATAKEISDMTATCQRWGNIKPANN